MKSAPPQTACIEKMSKAFSMVQTAIAVSQSLVDRRTNANVEPVPVPI
jgi:hypothetical protein